MQNDPNTALFADTTCAELGRLLQLCRDECSALAALLPAVGDSQWLASPALLPGEDTTERSKGIHGDPTPGIALDARRLALRAQIQESEIALRGAAIAVRGVRRGLERRLADWEGEGEHAE